MNKEQGKKGLLLFVLRFPVYEVAVDLWSNTIAMKYPFQHIRSLFKISFKQASDLWKWTLYGNNVGP